MSLNLGDVDALLDDGIRFTVRSKEYWIPPVSGAVGLWVQRMTAGRLALGPDATEDQARAALGATDAPPVPDGMTLNEAMLSRELIAALIEDGVDVQFLDHLTQTVYIRIVSGDQLALAYAQSGGEAPNSSGPTNRQERRAASKTAKTVKATSPKTVSSSKTTSTAAAPTTRKAASGSGTSTRKPAAAKKARSGSPGASS